MRYSRRALLGLIPVGVVLAACTGNVTALTPAAAPAKPTEPPAKPAAEPTKPAASAAPTAPAAQAPAKAGGGKVRYLYNATPGPNEKVHLDLIDLYGKLYPGVEVEKIRVPDDAELTRKLLAMIAAKDLPDFYWNRQRTATPFFDRGVVLDINPRVAADKVDLKDFWPSAIKTYTREGKLYGLPNSASSHAYYFNVDMYKKAGVPLPTETASKGAWNWDAIVDQGKKLSGGEGPTRTFGFNAVTSIYQVDQFIWQNGGDLWDEKVTVCKLNEPEAVGAIQWLVDCAQKHKIMPTSTDTKAGGDMFVAGRCGLVAAGRYILDTLLNSKFEVGMVVGPNGPKANTVRGDDLAASILKDAANPDAAWNFAKMWTSDDGQKLVLASRRSFTARRSFAQGDWMKTNLLPWENLETYMQGLERTGVYIAPGQTGEVNSVFDRELDLAYLGEKSVKDATDAMKRDIDAALKKPL
ncbi:MAG TPA: sugar ABC transporter substrate-binding protein [Chloroflexota bacterium]|nr:sugar ABC transporter substrate-binding protein [Chloroflexota bacterium]